MLKKLKKIKQNKNVHVKFYNVKYFFWGGGEGRGFFLGINADIRTRTHTQE